jgi:hypothetical protein
MSMMFGTGILLAGGATIVISLVDKLCEELGFHILGTILKLILPIVGFGLCIYFLENNPFLWWLR